MEDKENCEWLSEMNDKEIYKGLNKIISKGFTKMKEMERAKCKNEKI